MLYMKQLMCEVKAPSPISVEFFVLLEIFFEKNFGLFKGKLYKFPEDGGVPIELSLGFFMGDLFMDMLENEVVDGEHPLSLLCWWYVVSVRRTQ